MAFKTKGQLNDHQNIHSNYRPFKCYFCQAAFNRKTRLKLHIMIHTGEKPFICDYPNCNKKFREKGNLNSHYKKHFKFIENKSLANTTVSGDIAFLLGNNNINNKEIQFLNDSSFSQRRLSSFKEKKSLLKLSKPNALSIISLLFRLLQGLISSLLFS